MYSQAGRLPKAVRISRGEGSLLFGESGERWVDFTSGVLVLAPGHSHPVITEAVKVQAARAINVYGHDTNIRDTLSDRLLSTFNGDFDSLVFQSTGTEGVDTALRIARAATGKPGVVSFTGSFHGKSTVGVEIGGDASSRHLFGNGFAGPVVRTPFPYPYRWPLAGDLVETSLTLLRASILAEGPQRLGAIIIEGYLGAGGGVNLPEGYLAGLRGIADEFGMLLVFDEFQSGMGRGAGTMWTYQDHGVVPDIVIGAKHMGSGLPISAVFTRSEIMESIPNGLLTSTFGGNPLSGAAALATLDVFESEDLLTQGQRVQKRMRERFDRWQSALEVVGEARCAGVSGGIEFVVPGTTEPNREIGGPLTDALISNGVLCLPVSGMHGNVLRLAPALNMPDSLIDEGLDLIEQSILAVART